MDKKITGSEYVRECDKKIQELVKKEKERLGIPEDRQISIMIDCGRFSGGYTDKYGELYGEVRNYSESLEESTILTIIGYLKKEKTNKLKQALQAPEWRY